MNKNALNLKIDSNIYKQLDDATNTNGQSKTYIVEQALLAYLGGNVEESTDVNVDNVEESTNANTEVEERLKRLEEAFYGITCPINLASPTELPLEATEDTVEDISTQTDKQAVLEPKKQGELAERFGVSGQAVSKQKNKESFPEWSKLHDPDGIAWQFDPDHKLFVPMLALSTF